MEEKIFVVHNEKETQKLAFETGLLINTPFYIALKGELGAGKTCFVQGLAKGLETAPDIYVTSPTYNIIQTYNGRIKLVHADLYRIFDIDELELTGFTDIIAEESVLCVEWPDKIEKDFHFDLIIEIEIIDLKKRKIKLIPCGLKASHLLDNMSFK